VVLPTHDRPGRLAGALSSVLAQSYGDFEVVVVDDASAEPALPVVDTVAGGDGRVRVLRLTEHAGAARARNAAVERSTGDIVAFLDDDDRWEPDKLRRQVAYLDAHPEVGLVSCHHTVVDERRHGETAVFRGPSAFSAEQVQWMNFPGSFSFVAVRRSLVGDALRIDESFPSVEDWDLWLRCLRRAPGAVVEEPLVRHTVHGDPRLSAPASERRGHELFLRKHGAAMPAVCRAYAAAHLRMYAGTGWSHRVAVACAVVGGPPLASGILAVEQAARRVGRARRDPGLVARTMAHVIGADGRAGTVRHLTALEEAEARQAVPV
jgi:hypothetical protein